MNRVTPGSLALLLHEANFAPQGSVQSALGLVGSAPLHPRLSSLRRELAAGKRACWAAIAAATATEPPPDGAGIRELMVWEVNQASALSPGDLATGVAFGGEQLSVAELLQLNIRRSLGQAGQMTALAGRVQYA